MSFYCYMGFKCISLSCTLCNLVFKLFWGGRFFAVLLVDMNTQTAAILHLLATLRAWERPSIHTVDITDMNFEVEFVGKHTGTQRTFHAWAEQTTCTPSRQPAWNNTNITSLLFTQNLYNHLLCKPLTK